MYSRAAKSITLSPAAQAMLGLAAAPATPNEIIRAILRMPVDLLWNGGIGTYVKASDESHNEVGDRANDAVRVNGAELRAKVVGEGGNLGFSQRGRVEYALAGGRLNTDFIDNSAGVNTSDVEVNIKILLNPLMEAGKLTRGERNKLLARMTNEVAALVLRNNYLQSQAISTLEMQSAARLAEYQHLIRSLERTGELNRALEFLPADEELAERRKRGARAHAAGARGGARVQQDLAEQSPARLGRAGRPVSVARSWSAISRRRCASASRARFRGIGCGARSSPRRRRTAS